MWGQPLCSPVRGNFSASKWAGVRMLRASIHRMPSTRRAGQGTLRGGMRMQGSQHAWGGRRKLQPLSGSDLWLGSACCGASSYFCQGQSVSTAESREMRNRVEKLPP